MNLRTYILSICVSIVLVVTVFFYAKSSSILGSRFKELEVVQLRSVKDYTNSILQGRKYLLATFRREFEKDNGLSSLLLLAANPKYRDGLRGEIRRIKERTGCDLVEIIDLRNEKGVVFEKTEWSKAILRDVAKGKPIVGVQFLNDVPMLISYSTVRLYRDVIGVAALGFSLNGRISDEVSKATQSEIQFVRFGTQSGEHWTNIPLNVVEGLGTTVELSIASNFISEVKREVGGSILTAGIIGLLAVMVLIYLLLNAGFIRSFSEVLSTVNGVTSDLEQGVISLAPEQKYPIHEVTTLSGAIAKLSQGLMGFQARIEKKTRTEAIGEKSAQVAHDLKGPIAALEAALDLERNKYVSAEKKEGIKALLMRLRNIASDVTYENRAVSEEGASGANDSNPICNVGELVDAIVAEKAFQYSARENVSILIESPKAPVHYFAKINADELQRVLSNLIDNAVEAIEGVGNVIVRFCESDGRILIEVADNGKGVSRENLARVGERGFTSGKKSGSGLGVWYAKEVVGLCGGEFSMQSEQGVGMCVSLRIPVGATPSWFLPGIELDPKIKIVVLDDDPAIHSMWKERLSRFVKKGKLEVFHFTSIDQFLGWHARERRQRTNILFLCDYELKGQVWNGLQVIEELQLAKGAILVTGHFVDKSVRTECERLGVKLVSKSTIAFISIALRQGKKQTGVA